MIESTVILKPPLGVAKEEGPFLMSSRVTTPNGESRFRDLKMRLH